MKKIKFIAPLAVVATIFATSCNKGWPTLSEADAITRAAKVAEIQKELADLKSSIVVSNGNGNGKTTGQSFNSSYNSRIEIDTDQKYVKETISSKSTLGSSTLDYSYTTYLLKKDNNYYKLSNNSGVKTKEKLTDSVFDTEFAHYGYCYKAEYLKYIYLNFGGFVDLSNLQSTITACNNRDEALKAVSKDYYYNYSFISNSETNFGFKYDTKFPDSSNAIYTWKDEYRLENGYRNYENTSKEYKLDDNNYSTANTSLNLQINPNITIDNVNLDEYTEV